MLQHADNSVDWYPWGPEALEKARSQDKPIFLSIGYAACHWCHVMAHESFENPATAAIMNEYFVNIKVDREERLDLDGIYMQAVVAMTGQGGWPMSVFLAPDGRPFYGGTYFPPVPRYNKPAFGELLLTVVNAWKNDLDGLLENGRQMLDQVREQGLSLAPAPAAGPASLQPAALERAASALAQSYDWTHGGWGWAPRFPQPMTIEYLLRRATRGDRQALEMAVHALRAMAKGGMYDVVGGGFARYATDDRWHTPHFKKMLYDNAQLARAYLHAWQLCGGETPENTPSLPSEIKRFAPALRAVCEQTLDFVLREMTHPLGGFYSSLDADSQGEEGKFYTWTPQEIRAALGKAQDAELVIAAYQVTEGGNFEGKNILQRARSDEQLAEQFGLSAAAVPDRLRGLHARLLEARAQRVRPSTDDKILVSWNALMLAAFAEAGRGLGRPDYLAAAQRNARFLLENLVQGSRPVSPSTAGVRPVSPSTAGVRMMRSWRGGEPPPLSGALYRPSPISALEIGEGEGRARHNAYLEDYAALVLGLLALYQSDANVEWYAAAVRLADEMVAHYADVGEAGSSTGLLAGGFFDTRDDHEALLYRPKEVQDNATPSGNALAACALLQLAAYGDRMEGRSRAEAMLGSIQDLMVRYPTAFAQWLCAADFALGPVQEIAVLGEAGLPHTDALLHTLWKRYRPRQVTAISAYPPACGSPALLNDRPLKNGLPTAYVCRGSVCQQPVNSPEELEAQLG